MLSKTPKKTPKNTYLTVIKNTQLISIDLIIKNKDNKIFILKPSIRKYKQPQQFTSETSIQRDGLSDVYIAMDYAGDSSTGIGVRFYYNYFVRLIWISFALITIGGIVSFARRRNEKTI